MTSERWEQIGHLYEQALSCPTEQRTALLDHACAGDAALRREVESMISAYEADPDFLEQSALPLIGHPDALAGAAGPLDGPTCVGPYRLIRPLGRGGMGEVFLAVRALARPRSTKPSSKR